MAFFPSDELAQIGGDKITKMAAYYSKWPTSCLYGDRGSVQVFVRPCETQLPTKFRVSRPNGVRGPIFSNLIGAAVPPFFYRCHGDPYYIKIPPGPDVHANFHEFSGMFRGSTERTKCD